MKGRLTVNELRERWRTMMLVVAMTALAFGQSHAEPPKSMPADVGPGRVAWFDVTTTDLPKSKEFYGRLFDWKFTPVQGTDQAVEIVAGGSSIGTMRLAEGSISASNGVVYVQVKDIEAACRKAKELGGTVLPGFPFNLSNGTGAIGLFTDPAGHPMGIYSRTPIAPPQPAAK
jgi:predicted enzyme related to lactoylglutathione lyase